MGKPKETLKHYLELASQMHSGNQDANQEYRYEDDTEYQYKLDLTYQLILDINTRDMLGKRLNHQECNIKVSTLIFKLVDESPEFIRRLKEKHNSIRKEKLKTTVEGRLEDLIATRKINQQEYRAHSRLNQKEDRRRKRTSDKAHKSKPRIYNTRSPQQSKKSHDNYYEYNLDYIAGIQDGIREAEDQRSELNANPSVSQGFIDTIELLINDRKPQTNTNSKEYAHGMKLAIKFCKLLIKNIHAARSDNDFSTLIPYLENKFYKRVTKYFNKSPFYRSTSSGLFRQEKILNWIDKSLIKTLVEKICDEYYKFDRKDECIAIILGEKPELSKTKLLRTNYDNDFPGLYKSSSNSKSNTTGNDTYYMTSIPISELPF